MVDLARPEYGTPWASEGEIAAPTQDKVELGWVQEMMPFQWENYLQNRQDSAITYLLQKGISEYSGTQEYIANKSVVVYQGAVFIATQTSTGELPTTTASWKRLSTISNASGVVSVAGGGTGATTAEVARTNLGLGTASLLSADVVVQKDESGNFSAGTITASLAGNATSADKWKTARTINITGAATSDTKSMDGTANTTLTISELDATKLVGVATVNTSGNAATATKLQTARTITLTGGASGVSNASDGSTDFTIGVTSLNASALSSGTVPASVLGNAVTKTSQTGSAALPSGTTAERDALPQEAYFRYNRTTKLPEFYDSNSWKSVTGLNTGNFVSKTSDTGAATLPAGTDAQRPAPEDIPDGLTAIRGNSTSAIDHFLEFWNGVTNGWDEVASRKWVDDLLAKTFAPELTGSATLTSTDNKLVMTSVATTLGLEKGDVVEITIASPSYKKLHTVESITDTDTIVLNYEHCGARGNGSLKLPDYSGAVTIKRVAKWFNAPIGLGQAWTVLTNFRMRDVSYVNSTGRAIVVVVRTIGDFRVGGITICQTGLAGQSYMAVANVPSGYEYNITGGNITGVWVELR